MLITTSKWPKATRNTTVVDLVGLLLIILERMFTKGPVGHWHKRVLERTTVESGL